jgi:hypothetical protein
MRRTFLGITAWAVLGVGGTREPATTAAAAAVAPLVLRSPTAGVTEVRDGAGEGALRARFVHLPDAAVRVAALPSGAVAAVADRAPGRDRSWGSSLLVAPAGGDGVERCDRVFYASRPLPLPDGRVVVERGRPGPALPGRIRVDELTIDVVDAQGGAPRTIYVTTGFEAHLAGVAGSELILYLIQPDLASLRAVDLDSGRERVIVPSLPPYARDFVIDGQTIVLRNRDDARRDLETLERIDLSSGARTRMRTW